MNKVNYNHRLASFILFGSFFLGFLIIKYIYAKTNLPINLLVHFWFAICILPLFIVAFIQNFSKQIQNKKQAKFNLARIRSKLVIILLQLLLIILPNFILNDYNLINTSTFINDVFSFLPYLIILIIIYVFIADTYLDNPCDEYYQISLMINHKANIDIQTIKRFLLKTLVKVIFIPFMYSGFIDLLTILLHMDLKLNMHNLNKILFNFGVSLDMLVGTFGYLFSFKLIDNDIKDTESNLLGWLFALLCYPPLLWIMNQINHQQDALTWENIIPNDTLFYMFFFVVINLLWVVYWLATFEFGMTFSNLSWRGLINKGVYRYTKHPAYISKNLYWWLNTLPFCGVTLFSLAWWQNILGLTFVSLIYYGRAWSEEKHLNNFSDYRKYSQRIDKIGIFRYIKLPPSSY